jgi:hypothetical protein
MSINCFTEAEDIGLAYSARRSKGLQRRSAEGPARGGVSWCVFGRGRRAYLPKRRARKVCTAWWCVVRGEGMDMQIEHGSKVKWSVSRSSGEALSQCARGPGFLGMGEALLPRLEKSHASMPHITSARESADAKPCLHVFCDFSSHLPYFFYTCNTLQSATCWYTRSFTAIVHRGRTAFGIVANTPRQLGGVRNGATPRTLTDVYSTK